MREFSELPGKKSALFFAILFRRGIIVAEARGHFVGALAGIVLELVAQVAWVDWILLALPVGIRQPGVIRQRLDGEGVRSVEVQVFLETISKEEVVARPARRQRGQTARIEVELHAFAGAEHGETVIRRA